MAAGVDDGNGPYLRPATKTVHRTQIHASAESHQGELPAAPPPPPPPPPPLLRCALAGTPGPRSSCRRSASQALDPATALMLMRAVRGFTRVRYPVASGGGSTRNATFLQVCHAKRSTVRCLSHANNGRYMCSAYDTVSENSTCLRPSYTPSALTHPMGGRGRHAQGTRRRGRPRDGQPFRRTFNQCTRVLPNQ